MNYGKVIDTRDLEKRLQELEDDLQTHLDANDQAEEDAVPNTEDNFEDIDELKSLRDAKEEVTEWRDGNTLIRDDHWEDYCREFAEEIGAISGSETWPLNCIDWEKAARELQMDYSSITINDNEYHYRS